VGYHGDDGNFFCCDENEDEDEDYDDDETEDEEKCGKLYGPKFTTGDTVGCCLNFRYNTVFYTKNGVNLGSY
jgi:Ran-binding protein 9/10